jgi:hypothetical protein
MNLFVISPTEIKAKVNDVVYDLAYAPPIQFAFKYLYYEPEVNHTRKVLEHDGKLIYVDLSESEKANIEMYLANTEELEKAKKAHDEFVELAQPVRARKVAFSCDAEGKYKGMREVGFEEGYFETTCRPPAHIHDKSWFFDYTWDFDAKEWVLEGGYNAHRRKAYFDAILVGDQLGALTAAIVALANNQPLPTEFTDIVAKINTVKTSIPKE